MNRKKRSVPLILRQEEALYRRLPDQYEKRRNIEHSIQKRWAGYRGELALDYFLDFLPKTTFHVFEDLRLFTSGKTFQIDTLLLTPHAGFIIEVKNISGTIIYEGNSQPFRRILQGKEERLPNPIAQVNRQKIQLEHWFHARGIHDYPIIPHVALSSPSTNMDLQADPTVPITHLDETIERIQEVYSLYKRRKSFELGRISEKLVERHRPYYSDILGAYSIPASTIETGVQCPECQRYAMARIRRLWECPFCKTRSSEAHYQAIADYFLLFGQSMTNKECREFLHLSSRYSMTKLLKRSSLVVEGETKGRIYQMPANIEKWLK
ncbi:Nuclease-related domain-containing protein [Halobacillus alkaliphilus]|uniref:Nuclease-related domain-containing protein n=1 Tax=Halobacillus alkaliphilus TaxID=396056 RepID=A0A1I2Q5W8_9BACI|nr:nuclease-related domain-containing protein [Halobacillus alkaliphilus]SFG21196.1 Nuclease-related domain-containing protein [Halobacillus alkaliphilus]